MEGFKINIEEKIISLDKLIEDKNSNYDVEIKDNNITIYKKDNKIVTGRGIDFWVNYKDKIEVYVVGVEDNILDKKINGAIFGNIKIVGR